MFFFSYQLCYLPEGGHICTRPKVEGKSALSMADNSADMKKNPCDNLYITCLVSLMQCFI